jgi:hypothetical protein
LLVQRIAALLLAAAVAGCASHASEIQPAPIQPSKYAALSCGQIAAEQARVSSSLVNATAEQEQKRANDSVGVLLLGLPVASMTNNGASEAALSDAKGEDRALRDAAAVKKCS